MPTPGLDLATALDALAAALEALDIPNGATTGDQEIRDRILVERAGHARLMLKSVLLSSRGHDFHDPQWAIGYLRDRLAEHPAVGFKTWDERVAELDATHAYTESQTDPGNCAVCHFFHKDRRNADGSLPAVARIEGAQ